MVRHRGSEDGAKAPAGLVSGGLRERKKAERRAALLEAARESFAARGFDETSIEELAARVDVSVGTVYNYFATKFDLLFEILFTDMKPVIERGQAFIGGAPPLGRDSLLTLLQLYFDWLGGYERTLLRRFTAEAIAAPDLDERSYYYLETLLTRQIGALIRQLQRRGEIRPDVAIDDGARLIFNLANSEFYTFLADNDQSAAQAITRLSAQIDLVWSGMVSQRGNI